MPITIEPMTFGSGAFSVNAYLLRTDVGCVLVDTGMRGHRQTIESRIADSGCAEQLKLIVITHGDVDHVGNAGYLRERFGAPIAMNEAEVPMTRDGDMLANRSARVTLVRRILRSVVRLKEGDRFEPDVLLDENSDLAEYGLEDARVLLLKGHSNGSIGLLFADGRLISGDVVENRAGQPKIGSIMDDAATARASVERLRGMGVTTVYPGHGAPFEMSRLVLTELEKA